LKLFFECVPKAFGTDEEKAEKMDKKIIWEHTNYFRITSKQKRRPGLPDGAFSNLINSFF